MPWYKVCIRLINKLGFTVLFFFFLLHKLKTYKNIYNKHCVVKKESEIHKTDVMNATIENIQIVSKDEDLESQTIQNSPLVEKENALSKSSNQPSSPI